MHDRLQIFHLLFKAKSAMVIHVYLFLIGVG